jgi:hypothetical protein
MGETEVWPVVEGRALAKCSRLHEGRVLISKTGGSTDHCCRLGNEHKSRQAGGVEGCRFEGRRLGPDGAEGAGGSARKVRPDSLMAGLGCGVEPYLGSRGRKMRMDTNEREWRRMPARPCFAKCCGRQFPLLQRSQRRRGKSVRLWPAQ